MSSLALIRICIGVFGAGFGAFLIAMGIGYYHVQSGLAELYKDAGISQPTFIVVGLGIIIFVMALLSILSAIRNTILCKLIYCSILGLVISFLVIIAIMVFVKHGDFLEQSGQMFDHIWKNRDKQSSARFLDKVNQYFHCCGSQSSVDYSGNVPPSCCNLPIENTCETSSIYTNGCRKLVVNYISSKAELIGSVAIITAVILSIVVICSFI